MTNADKFKSLFGLYATELWSMPEKDFLEWLNSEVSNSSESPNNWIPCSERLPDGITQVIIQTNGEAIHEAFYMGKDDYGHYVWRRLDGGIYWNEDVVAWMPLPEPYRKEGEHE